MKKPRKARFSTEGPVGQVGERRGVLVGALDAPKYHHPGIQITGFEDKYSVSYG